MKARMERRQCERIGKIVKGLRLRPSHCKREFLSFKADRETKLRAFLFASAICHQTHSLVSRKRNLKGWDCLEHAFLELGKRKSRLLEPACLSGLTEKGLSEELKPLFSDDGKPESCTLDRLEERSRFLIGIARMLEERYGGKIGNLVESSGGFLEKRGSGLYEVLGRMEAFSDPAKKKSTLFLMLAQDAGLLRIRDPENLVPIMDYHMQRVLLRMGCVEVPDRGLKRKLQNRERLASDKEIRDACIQAIRAISESSGCGIFQVHDFFWPLGRSCCREKTLCFDRVCSKSPCTFTLFVELPEHRRCVFEGVCKGGLDGEYRKCWQPIVDTHYY